MSLVWNERATPTTRVRLTYRIKNGVHLGAENARATAARINAYLEALPASFYVVTPASEPQQGGASGNLITGLLNAALGVYDRFTSVDVQTTATAPSGTWAQVFEQARNVGAAGWASLETEVELVDATIVSRTSAAATSATAQQATASTAAGASRAAAAPNVIGDALGNVTKVVLVGLLVGLVIYVYLKRRT